MYYGVLNICALEGDEERQRQPGEGYEQAHEFADHFFIVRSWMRGVGGGGQ